MILVPRKNLYLSERKWGQPKFQRGIICATAVFGSVAAGDTVTLNNASCEDTSDTGGGASARIRCYNVAASSTRKGETWGQVDGTYVFSHDVVIPAANIDDYQMKWEALSGQAPNDNVVAVSVWHPLSTSSFYVGWDAPGDDDSRAGSCTVSIRKGTGSTLDTGIWDGDVSSTPAEKDK